MSFVAGRQHPLLGFASYGNQYVLLNLAEWIFAYQETFLADQGAVALLLVVILCVWGICEGYSAEIRASGKRLVSQRGSGEGAERRPDDQGL